MLIIGGIVRGLEDDRQDSEHFRQLFQEPIQAYPTRWDLQQIPEPVQRRAPTLEERQETAQRVDRRINQFVIGSCALPVAVLLMIWLLH